jgi:trk system potassium uptake protein TrkA
MKGEGFILIVGCGRVGRYLAVSLSNDGYGVVVLDKNEDSLKDLGPEFRGSRVKGDGTDLAVLQSVETANAAAVVAVTPEDAVNLMVTQAAKSLFHVRRVMARVNDSRREELFQQLGIETISPESEAAESLRKALIRTE